MGAIVGTQLKLCCGDSNRNDENVVSFVSTDTKVSLILILH